MRWNELVIHISYFGDNTYVLIKIASKLLKYPRYIYIYKRNEKKIA
jgi:hypothetical protein